MTSTAMALRQVKFENRSFWRNPAAAFFTFAFPLMFLFIFNTILGHGTIRVGPHETIERTNFYVPSIAVFSVITACFTNIAMSISFSRDEGVLKRKLGTPLPKWAFFAGRVIHATLMELLLIAIVAAAGVLLYGVDLPTHTLPQFAATLLVGALAFSCLGFAVTSLVPNADAAPAVINGIILPLLFISGVFFGLDATPVWLVRFSDFFPVHHYLAAMIGSFLGDNPLQDFKWIDLAIVAAWGIGGLIVAVKTFSWEPRR
jgi:ABC-2 type transport system permease protein